MNKWILNCCFRAHALFQIWSSNVPGPLFAEVIVSVRVPAIGQINLFENYSYSLGICNQKPLKKLNKKCKYECIMNTIP